jgi:anti-sigma regulatory factor (Ser/Thr protein kinase)
MESRDVPTSAGRSKAVWDLNANDVDDAWGALRAALGWLAESGLGVDRVAARVVMTELVGNAVRHAGGSGELAIEVAPDAVLVHVTDQGGGCAAVPSLPAASSEGGRGLFLVREYARALTLHKRAGGGTHAIASLRYANETPGLM